VAGGLASDSDPCRHRNNSSPYSSPTRAADEILSLGSFVKSRSTGLEISNGTVWLTSRMGQWAEWQMLFKTPMTP
jgi:hypothetical protein